jgi:hypothetical protein
VKITFESSLKTLILLVPIYINGSLILDGNGLVMIISRCCNSKSFYSPRWPSLWAMWVSGLIRSKLHNKTICSSRTNLKGCTPCSWIRSCSSSRHWH